MVASSPGVSSGEKANRAKPSDVSCGCNWPGGDYTDPSGDSIEGDSLIGTPLSDGGYDTSNLYSDFGTYEYDDGFDVGSIVAFEQVEGYPAMSDACQEALSNLNATFINFMGWAFGTAITMGKWGIKPGLGVGAGAVGQVASLNAAQKAVNIECSGQGAGMNPNGPLPSGYEPGS